MALSNYAELQTAIGEWLNRGDLTPRIPDFIVLAESSLRRRLRAKTLVEQTFNIPAGSTPVTLGFDVQAIRSVRLERAGAATPLTQVTIEALSDLKTSTGNTAGVPQLYAIANGTLYLAPVPDQAYVLKLSYYELLPPLATSPSGTNWLLIKYPDCYLYAALVESAPFLQEDERLAVWGSRLDQIVFEINREYEREELGANVRTPRLSRVF